jgi:hypothetical protein
MKKLIFLFALMLISCNNEGEETRIFTVTTNAIPPEGGTVTLELGEATTGQYKWGDVANIKAKPSDGYVFENFTGNTHIGDIIVTTGNGAYELRRGYTSLEISCPDITFCDYDIIINGHFVKED